MVVMAPATVSTASLQVLVSGKLSKLQRLAYETVDRSLVLLEFLLRFEKTARHRILQQGVTVLFELGNLRIRQLHALGLLVMKAFSGLADPRVLCPRSVIDQELLHAEPCAFKGRFREDRAAEFFKFCLNVRGQCGHEKLVTS